MCNRFKSCAAATPPFSSPSVGFGPLLSADNAPCGSLALLAADTEPPYLVANVPTVFAEALADLTSAAVDFALPSGLLLLVLEDGVCSAPKRDVSDAPVEYAGGGGGVAAARAGGGGGTALPAAAGLADAPGLAVAGAGGGGVGCLRCEEAVLTWPFNDSLPVTFFGGGANCETSCLAATTCVSRS